MKTKDARHLNPPLHLKLGSHSQLAWSPRLPVVWLSQGELPAIWQSAVTAAFSTSEQNRYQALSANKQTEFLTSRALLRLALSAHESLTFSSEVFSSWLLHTRQGHPPQVKNSEKPLTLGISHCPHGYAVALAHTSIGIDLEAHRPVAHTSQIAERVFPAKQQQALAAAGDDLDLFFRYWTQKEAAFKAASASDRPTAFFSTAPPPKNMSILSCRWRHYTLSVAQLMSSNSPPDIASGSDIQLVEVTFSDSVASCVEISPDWIAY